MQGFTHYQSPGLTDRYLPPNRLKAALGNLPEIGSLSQIGESVENRPIYGIKWGQGERRVLMWSQMHGNESTTTRALLDMVMAIGQDEKIRQRMSGYTLFLIPMLNPDGADAYTRNNANDVDLNRDAQARSQPEIQALFKVFDSFKPDYCFNLHDQRSRYGVGNPPAASNISFLAPAADAEKTITPARRVAMQLIAGLANRLQQLGPLGIGRYDDTYNVNCIGDTFVSLGVPSILFEAGFFPGDYRRQESRQLVYQALLSALELIGEETGNSDLVESYFNIPENSQCYADIILRNAIPEGKAGKKDLILNYDERLRNGSIDFVPAPLEEDYAENYMGHREFDLLVPGDRERLQADPALCHFLNYSR